MHGRHRWLSGSMAGAQHGNLHHGQLNKTQEGALCRVMTFIPISQTGIRIDKSITFAMGTFTSEFKRMRGCIAVSWVICACSDHCASASHRITILLL